MSIIAINVLDGAVLTADVVRMKINFYLGTYLAYFLCLYVAIYIWAMSRVGAKAVVTLYESAYDSGIYSKSAKLVTAAPENSDIKELLEKVYEKNRKMKQMIRFEKKMKETKARNSTTSPEFVDSNIGNAEGRDSERMSTLSSASSMRSSPMTSSRRVSMNTRLLSMMMKNKEKVSESFQDFLNQERLMLGSAGILYPDGYHLDVCGRRYTLSVGLLENFLLYICINHAFFNCFYYVKGSKLGRHGTKLLYICREVVVFVMSQFFTLVVQYTGVQGTGTDVIFNLFVVVPLARTVGFILVTLYTCPCTNSVEFQSKYSRIHGYVLLLGRLAVLPILFVIFGALVAACIFSTTEQIGLILANYFINVQAFGIILQLVLVARLYVEEYYFELCLWKYKVFSLGGVYLEQIVHKQLKNNVDFTVSKGSYVCGLIRTLKIRSRAKTSDDRSEHVAIEMTTAEMVSSEEDTDDDGGMDDGVQVAEDSNTNNLDVDVVQYDNIYTSNVSDDKIVYDDKEITSIRSSYEEYTTRVSSQQASGDSADGGPSIPGSKMSTKTNSAASETTIDVANSSVADLLKRYRAEMVHVETNAGRGEDESVVDDQLFEEWKNAKRKQFKAGTRKSFVKAYNLYEDLFSKRDATSSKQSVKSAKEGKASHTDTDSVVSTENPMLKEVNPDGARPSVSSAENTRKLFSQPSFRGRNLLDTKRKL